MKTEQTERLHYLVLICSRKHRLTFTRLLADEGGQGLKVIYGRGSVKASAFARALGLAQETHRAIITCLIPTGGAERVIDALNRDHGFDRPGTGMAFTIPVEGISF